MQIIVTSCTMDNTTQLQTLLDECKSCELIHNSRNCQRSWVNYKRECSHGHPYVLPYFEAFDIQRIRQNFHLTCDRGGCGCYVHKLDYQEAVEKQTQCMEALKVYAITHPLFQCVLNIVQEQERRIQSLEKLLKKP